MKKKKLSKTAIALIVIVSGAAVLLLIQAVVPILLVGLLIFGSATAPVEVNTDISKYEQYIGENADEQYDDKWGMDETIFPQTITDEMQVEDYKMVYYNPWDAQYLSYLVVQYDEDTYEEEVARLEVYESTDYLGYYGAEGFAEQYDLLAMYADDYQGFVYALTDREDTIIYVEIIFCNYFMDLEYWDYIKEEYLPVGFDASSNNPYEKKMMGR